MAPVMIIGSVPLYNVMAVIVLSFFKPGQNGIDRAVLKKTFKGIVTNPIIFRNCCRSSVVSYWSAVCGNTGKGCDEHWQYGNAMGLMAMGATFDLKKSHQQRQSRHLQPHLSSL